MSQIREIGCLIENTARYLRLCLFLFCFQHKPLYLSIILNWSMEGNTPHGKATDNIEANKELVYCVLVRMLFLEHK